MLRRFTLISLLALAAVFAAGATVRHINVRDGLSSRQVYEIEQDLDGYVWIYTNSGIDRYDGSGIRHYNLDTGEEQNDHIQSASSMQTSLDGLLWVAVKSGGIYRYDVSSDRFVLKYDFRGLDCLLYNFMVQPDGSLTVCTNRGLYSCSKSGGISKLALDGKFVGAVCGDGNGGYYAGTDHGVYHVRAAGGSWRSRPVKGTENVNVKSLILSGGYLYIGSFSQGILVMDPADYRLRRLPFDIPWLPVNSLTEYSGNRLLIGIDGAGVYMVNSADGGSFIRHFRDGDGSDADLSGNTVTDVHVDRQLGIWIATSHNGLNYISPYSHAVTLIKSTDYGNGALVSDYVNVIYEDRDGDLWFGTDKGVSRYSAREKKWWRYLQRSDYVASVVLSFGEDADGRILAGTYGDGISVIDKHSGKVSRMLSQSPGSDRGIGTDYVFVGRVDAAGHIWTGGINGPLTCYEPVRNAYSYYDVDCIATTAEDSDGRLLFGGNKGVGVHDAANDRFIWTTRFDSIQIKYPVRVLALDSAGNTLWIGTQGEGLVRYDRKSGRARRFTTADGLSSNTIYGLTADLNGNMWVCTETDLYRIDPADNKLVRLTYYLGTDRGVFNAGGLYTTRKGQIMVGSAEGCYVFNPSDKFDYNGSGQIHFTDFRIHDHSVAPGGVGSPLKVNIDLTDRLELDHNRNAFEIGFTIINFADPQRVGFEYMLEGYDRTPVNSGAGARARYSDLPPGDYTLIVKAMDLYSGKPVSERRLAVTVRPPFWLGGWAMALYCVVALGIAVFGIVMVKRVRRERRIEAQLQSYATIAHDIRTPMSMIKAPLLSVEHEPDLSESARANLRQARNGIDKTMAMLSDLLGMRRDARGSRQLHVQPVNILKYLQVKAEEYSSLALFKGIDIECKVDDTLGTVYVDSDKFDHIVDNLMSNAMKYTHSGKVTLRASRSGRHRWTLSVTDTGIGISKADARHIFRSRHRSAEAVDCDNTGIGMGLLLTRRLVRDHRGRIRFDSEPGSGSTFSVTLPMKYPARFMAVVREEAAAAVETAGTETAEEKGEGRSTIFAIEDDADMLEYLRENLSDDYNMVCSDNPSTALEEIRRLNPDLVISDVMMPRLRGDELCTMLKTNVDTSHIPVILLTGLAGRSDIVAGLEARADDYIVKPFDIVVLRARIRNIIKARRELGRRMLAEDCQPAQEEFASELDRRFMTRTMEVIDSHLGDSEYSVNELCRDLGMSRTSVYNKIKSISGQSPNEFMRIMRLNRAKELLATRSYNISEVAYMVGFSDPKYFSTCFKKQFGISPSKV